MAAAVNALWGLAYDELYQDLDRYRRWLGDLCDVFGYGPESCPHWELATGTPALLYRYPSTADTGPVVVLVPAPIKSADIWDLAPSVSVVRRYLEAGLRTYLILWPRLTDDGGCLGLSDYAERMLLGCVDTVRSQTGVERVHLTGHSIGGLFAALFAARHPQRVGSLTLLGTPLHFGPQIGALGRLVSLLPDTRALIDDAQTVPGTLLNIVSAVASPQTFIVSRGMDYLASLADPERLRMHLLVERWTLDESAIPRRLFLDLVDRLYRQDAFAAGRLYLGGRAVTPGDIVAPVTCVADRGCEIAPPESVLPVLAQLGSQDCKLLWYLGDTGVSMQHVGMLIGRSAHRELWPQLLARIAPY